MEGLYKSFKDLIRLFSYGTEYDEERYETSWYDLFIDKTTGKLINTHYVSRDPFSIRPGTVSSYEYEMTYERLKEILAREEIKDGSKYQSLTQDNWKAWLIENKLV